MNSHAPANVNSATIEQLKAEFKARISYIHLVSSLIPETPSHLEPNSHFSETSKWVDSAPETEIREKAPSVLQMLDQLVTVCKKRLPPKKDWEEIAAEHWLRLKSGEFSFTHGIACGWLVGRFDCKRLGISEDMPYHARIGIGHHAGNAAVEEEFLLRDAFFMLAKCQVNLRHLEGFRGRLQASLEKESYKMLSMFNQNVATYGRYAVFGFYSFVECFVNSVGEDFVARNSNVPSDVCEMLKGKKDGRYLSIEKKLEVFPGLIRSDGKRLIVLSDPRQITEPYKSFASHVKEVRDSSAHFAKCKTDIIVPPQRWETRAKTASTVCLSVARGLWKACFPQRDLPLYLGKLNNARHLRIAEGRVNTENLELKSGSKTTKGSVLEK